MELMDIYDGDRRPTGRVRTRGTPSDWLDGEYYLVVHLCVMNSRDELLIQRRSPEKNGWPGLWDVSAGGCAQAGETSIEAVRRETREELGLNVELNQKNRFYTFYFEHGFDDYYLLRQDPDLSALRLQTEEVQDVKWADRDEVFRLLGKGAFIPFFPGLLHLLFDCGMRRGTFYDSIPAEQVLKPACPTLTYGKGANA